MHIDSPFHGLESFQVRQYFYFYFPFLFYFYLQNLRHVSLNDSLPWSAPLTDGTGEPNPEGIDHYNNLIDALLAKGKSLSKILIYSFKKNYFYEYN